MPNGVSLKSNMELLHRIKFISCVLLIMAYAVETQDTFSMFRNVHFSFGTSISTSSGVKSVLACVFTCGDTCGYVQYTPDGTCVLYSQAVILTEPATVEGQVQGYHKVRRAFINYLQTLILHIDVCEICLFLYQGNNTLSIHLEVARSTLTDILL